MHMANLLREGVMTGLAIFSGVISAISFGVDMFHFSKGKLSKKQLAMSGASAIMGIAAAATVMFLPVSIGLCAASSIFGIG